jgi:hypothetical protein
MLMQRFNLLRMGREMLGTSVNEGYRDVAGTIQIALNNERVGACSNLSPANAFQ